MSAGPRAEVGAGRAGRRSARSRGAFGGAGRAHRPSPASASSWLKAKIPAGAPA